jgi:hypothetical protein
MHGDIFTFTSCTSHIADLIDDTQRYYEIYSLMFSNMAVMAVQMCSDCFSNTYFQHLCSFICVKLCLLFWVESVSMMLLSRRFVAIESCYGKRR